jgi:hypothetical protein
MIQVPVSVLWTDASVATPRWCSRSMIQSAFAWATPRSPMVM